LSVVGTVIPEAVNNEPTTAIPEIVTGPVPVELRTTDCVTVWPEATFPKFTLVVLAISVDTRAFSCKLHGTAPVFVDAVKVAVCVDDTASTVAVNATLVAFAGTVTDAGTVTFELLLATFTASPPLGAGALSVTVHVSVPLPRIETDVQVRLLGVNSNRFLKRPRELGSIGMGSLR
jgi:hypothetical protein